MESLLHFAPRAGEPPQLRLKALLHTQSTRRTERLFRLRAPLHILSVALSLWHTLRQGATQKRDLHDYERPSLT
jgi:hypothetical protein